MDLCRLPRSEPPGGKADLLQWSLGQRFQMCWGTEMPEQVGTRNPGQHCPGQILLSLHVTGWVLGLLSW